MVSTSPRRRYLAWLLRHLSFYPPYVGAGIRVAADDPGGVYRVRKKLAPSTRNAFGTHFGGSLYSMCDPFFALILIEQLGHGYTVWDKASTIDFLRPGRGTVSATFQIPHEQVEEIRELADAGQVVEPVFEVDVVDESGSVVARVTKTLHVKITSQRRVEPGARP